MGIGGCMLTWYTLAPLLMFIFFFTKAVKSCTDGRTLTVHEVVSGQDGKGLEVLSALDLLCRAVCALPVLGDAYADIQDERELIMLQCSALASCSSPCPTPASCLSACRG